jgi:hypothetical protein
VDHEKHTERRVVTQGSTSQAVLEELNTAMVDLLDIEIDLKAIGVDGPSIWWPMSK